MKKLLSIIITLTILLAVAGYAFAATPLIDNAFKITDTQGRPVPGGKVFTYEPGTTTPKITYSDEAGTVPNPNPVLLDTSGIAMIYGDGSYTIDVKDMFGSQVNGFPKIIDSILSEDSQKETVNSFIIDNINDLRSFKNDGDIKYKSVSVSGYYTPGDGGGGPKRIWLDSGTPGTYVDNGGTVIVPIGGNGSAAWLIPKTYKVNASWFGMAETASSTINSVAIQACIDLFSSSKGGTVELPGGDFNCDPDVITLNEKRNVTLTGVSSGYGYESSKSATRLLFANGTVGIDISLTGNDTLTSYNLLKNMVIVGSGTTYGVILDGINTIEDFSAEGFTEAGIYLRELINSASLRRVSAQSNLGKGILVGNATSNNTTFSMDTVKCRSNGIGLKIVNALNLRITNSVFESNTSEGVIIEKPTGRQCDNITFVNCWLENNYVGGSGYQLLINGTVVDGTPANSPTSIKFNDCEINASGLQKSINVNAAYGVNFNNLSMSSGLVTPGDSILINASYGRSVFFIDGFPFTPTLGYGSGGGRTERKFGGSAGIKTNADIHKEGGRTETVWFVIDTIVAGNTYFVSPATLNAAGVTMDNNTYPVLKSGSLVGLVTTRRNTIASGQLTVQPYFRTSWQSAAFDFTGSDVVLTSASPDDTRTIYDVEQYDFIDTYSMGIKIIADGSFSAPSGNQMLIGLVIEY